MTTSPEIPKLIKPTPLRVKSGGTRTDMTAALTIGGVALTVLGFILVFLVGSDSVNVALLGWVVLATGILAGLLGAHAMAIKQ